MVLSRKSLCFIGVASRTFPITATPLVGLQRPQLLLQCRKLGTGSPPAGATAARGDHWPFCVVRDVQWGELDLMNHVNNVIYLRWFESARVHQLIQLGVPIANTGRSVILAEQFCKYLKPVGFPDKLSIFTRTVSVGRSSWNTEYKIASEQFGGEVVATGHSRMVAYDYDKQSPCPLPEEHRRAIEELEGIAL